MTSPPYTVGFVGGGRIVRCIVGGWRAAGTLPGRIVVSEPDAGALGRLRAVEPGVRPAPLDEIGASDVVVLALHPPALRALLSGGGLRPARGSVVLSLAPGVTLAELEEALATCRLARAIPNAPSLVGHGFNPVAYGSRCPEEARETVASILLPLGQAPEVPEDTLEAWAVLTAMGPTYLWPLLDALRRTGLELGLDPRLLDEGLRRTAEGAARTLLDAGLPPEEVVDLVPARPLERLLAPVVAEIPERLAALARKIAP